MVRHFAGLFRRFRDDESGSIAVESLLMIPILIWCYLATYVFFDAFRMQSVNVKASYTIGDTLSRETGFVTPAYVQGLYNLQAVLLDTPEPRGLRITAYSYDETNDRFVVRWSQGLGTLSTGLTDATLANIRTILPDMSDGEVAILTQSRVGYVPDYQVGIDPFSFDEYTVMRPRFAPQVCWNPSETGGIATAVC